MNAVSSIEILPDYLKKGRNYFAEKKNFFIVKNIKNDDFVFEIVYDKINPDKFTLRRVEGNKKKESNEKDTLVVPFLDLIYSNFNLSSVSLFGKSNTGKTYFMRSLLTSLRKFFDLGIYITGSPQQCFDEFSDLFNKLFVVNVDDVNNAFIKRLSKIQSRRKEAFNFINKADLIYDIFSKVRLMMLKICKLNPKIAKKIYDKVAKFDNSLSAFSRTVDKKNIPYDEEKSIKKKMILVMKLFLKDRLIKNTFNKYENISTLNEVESFAYKHINFTPNIILILDDIGPKLSSEKGDCSKFSTLHTLNRHFGLLIIYLIQAVQLLSPTLRSGLQINIYSSHESVTWYAKYSETILTKKQSECMRILSREYFYRAENDYNFLVFLNPGGKVAIKNPIRYTCAVSDGHLPLTSAYIEEKMRAAEPKIKAAEAAGDKERLEMMFYIMEPPTMQPQEEDL